MLDLKTMLDGDRVVAAFPFRDQVFVVTEYGKIFQIVISERDGIPEIRMLS